MYACLSGAVPFNINRTDVTLDEQIKRGLYGFPQSLFGHISRDAIRLVRNDNALITLAIINLVIIDINYTVALCLDEAHANGQSEEAHNGAGDIVASLVEGCAYATSRQFADITAGERGERATLECVRKSPRN